MAFRSLILLLLISNPVHACGLATKVVSLSGPMTMLLEQMGLGEDPSLLAISNFHPVRDSIKTKRLLGGIFLSKKELIPYKGALVYYDKSQDLNKILTSARIENKIEIDSRGRDSLEVTNESLKLLKDNLQNCKREILEIKNLITKTKNNLSLIPKSKYIFFLGEIKNKLPDHIIAKDGFVLSLEKYANFETYKSDLAYVVWSRKELRQYTHFNYVGVSEAKGKKNSLIEEKITSKKSNFFYRGVLTPGISQVKFLNAFSESLTKVKQKQSI